MTFLAAPPPPPPPPPPPAAAAPAPRIIHQISVEDMMRAPTVIPKTIAQVKDEPEPPANAGIGVVGGVPGGVPGGRWVAYWVALSAALSAAAPPPPPPPKPQAPKRIRVGGQVESARLIFQPKPEYPPLAKMARIQGTVRLDAVISKDGTIQDLKVISGHPLLVRAALDAVQRWRYQPTLLNGDAVEVATEIDVNLHCQNNQKILVIFEEGKQHYVSCKPDGFRYVVVPGRGGKRRDLIPFPCGIRWAGRPASS